MKFRNKDNNENQSKQLRNILKIEETKNGKKQRFELREENRKIIFDLIRKLENDELVYLEGPSDLIEILLFDINEVSGEKTIDIPDDIIYRIDYTDISFANASVHDFDFTGMHGVFLNPQEVFNKNLRNTILNGVVITGSLEDVYIPGANFLYSEGALINPQEVYDKNLSRTLIADCIIVDDFDGVMLNDTIIYDTTMVLQKEDYGKVKEMKKSLKGL